MIQKLKTMIILYVLRTNDLTALKLTKLKTNNLRIKSLINKYKHVFQIKFLSKLSLDQDSDHYINIKKHEIN
jgi:hypothetical protein